MGAEIGRHLGGVMKKSWESRAVGRDQRVLRVEYIEPNAAVVGIDNCLSAIAHVIDAVAAGSVVTRVGVGRAFGESVDDPVETPIISDNDIRIVIVDQKRRDAVYDLADVAMNQHAAVSGDVV